MQIGVLAFGLVGKQQVSSTEASAARFARVRTSRMGISMLSEVGFVLELFATKLASYGHHSDRVGVSGADVTAMKKKNRLDFEMSTALKCDC